MGRAVELAGAIVDIQPLRNGTLIVVQNLPLKEHKPVETLGETQEGVQAGGTFAVLYPEATAKSEFEFGDKIVIVGKVQEEKMQAPGAAQSTRPFLVAKYLHVWKTGLYPIAQYEDLADRGLEQKTYCSK